MTKWLVWFGVFGTTAHPRPLSLSRAGILYVLISRFFLEATVT